jgi:5'-nucleotidase
VSGDMVQGSLIDTEYKGVSTMELMNYLAPDAATIGNHELDFGLAHLLFLEKMANFPIVVSNMYIKKYHKRLMRPFYIMNVDGFDVMFIGIITENVLRSLKMDASIGTHVKLEDAAAEVGRICDAYKDQDIDLTILLTHIGFEEDKKLAALLKPEWGVDLIIGGHSHTVLDQPATVNNVLIAQAGTGTNQIGRFDLIVDDDTNSIVEWKWKLLQVDNTLAEPDEELGKYIGSFREEVDRKYNTILCRLSDKLTHPVRNEETTLGNLFADILAKVAEVDVGFLNSGSLRGSSLGPTVTLGSLNTVFPYDGALYKCSVTGGRLKEMFSFCMSPENRSSLFLVSGNVRLVYNDASRTLDSLIINGEPVDEEKHYTISLQDYNYTNCMAKFGIPNDVLKEINHPRVVATSFRSLIEEYLQTHQNLRSEIEGRLVFKS